ncbi:hypothetical protein TNCV_493111 [Trichonephila clavipes]|nr:hypothetical protein TNCV_493111 [Trichonephila clavipes]
MSSKLIYSECGTNPTAVSSGTPKRGTTSRLTGVGSLLPPVYSEAWAKGMPRTPFSSLRDAAHGACSPNNKCLCVKRVWPMRRRVNLTSVLRIGITGHAPRTGFTECSLLSNC